MHHFSRIHCTMCRMPFASFLCQNANEVPSKSCIECANTEQRRGHFVLEVHTCPSCHGSGTYAMMDRYVQDEVRAYVAKNMIEDEKELRSRFARWLMAQPFWKNDVYTIEALLNIVAKEHAPFVAFLESMWQTAQRL